MTASMGRREILLGGAALIGVGPRLAGAAGAVPTAAEPLHHLVIQNGLMRIMRVLIPPGAATAWHEHRFDYGTVAVRGSRIREETEGEADGSGEKDVATGAAAFSAFQGKPAVRRVSNAGPGLYHQIAFELLRPQAGGFGPADRSHVPAFSMLLEQPRAKAWRLSLGPGVSTPTYTQDGPGLRVILQGDRLIETRPGEIGHDLNLRVGDAFFTLPGVRSLTNAADAPLELVEFELR